MASKVVDLDCRDKDDLDSCIAIPDRAGCNHENDLSVECMETDPSAKEVLWE